MTANMSISTYPAPTTPLSVPVSLASRANPEFRTPENKGITSASASRFLYRGALSLPDSMLMLDGLTFTAHLDTSDKSASKSKLDSNLLQNPLALALQSMRGRPSLRLLGTLKLKDVYLDDTGDVEMNIHPMAVLSRIYFENIFCLVPFPKSANDPTRSEVGVKVALGDGDGPDTTEMLIFAQVVPSADQNSIRLRVARLGQQPQNTHPPRRAPRPDDPIPRKPPLHFVQKQSLQRSGSLSDIIEKQDLKRVGSMGILANGPGPSKRAKLIRTKTSGADSDVFKVPKLPEPAQIAQFPPELLKSNGKERDVFGEVSEVGRQRVKGKQKEDTQGVTIDENTLEKANKNVIKRATIEYLEKTKDPTGRCIDKEHAEFKELYSIIQRGVVFALRSKMRAGTLDLRVVDRLIDMHALMYLGGCGGSAQMLW